MAAACGIDFGTSNSAVCIAVDGEVRPVIVDAGTRIANTTPTLLYWGEDSGPSFGSQAIERYIAEDMAGRFIQSIKKHLPSKAFRSTFLGGKERPIEELIGGFLRYLKDAIDQEAGCDVTRVVLGRPARFAVDDKADALAQDRLEKAAKLAGFNEVSFLREPIAAARAFEASLDREVLCLVGDLGGGTSDFSVVRLAPGRRGDRSKDVLGYAGVSIAGNDFDARIVWTRVTPFLGRNARYRPAGKWTPIPTVLHHAICRWHTLSFAARDREKLAFLDRMLRTTDDPDGLERLRLLLDAGCGYLFFESVEGTKVRLSELDQTRLQFQFEGLDLDVGLSRRSFESAIADHVDAIADNMDELLEQLELSPDDIGVVFLTGGTSRVPRVLQLFTERFGTDRIADHDVFTSVSQGLGLQARDLAEG